ncbi:hypothetical protein ACROYT_G028741 [Oculina patagonica]
MKTMKYLVIFVLVSVSFGFLVDAGKERLECLKCSGKGENAQEECDKNIVSEVCESTNEVCAVGHLKIKDGIELFHRGCIPLGEQYTEGKVFCEANPTECVFAMCETPNCKPELPAIGGN